MPPNVENPVTHENIMSLPWIEVTSGAWQEVQGVADRNGLKVSEKPQALRGGRMLAIDPMYNQDDPEFQSLAKYYSAEREIAIIPARSELATETDRLIILPSKEFPADKDFSANLAGFRIIEQYLAEKSGGKHPIPKLHNVMKLADGRWAIVTDYRKGITDFGLGDPQHAVHEMDPKKLAAGDIGKIYDAFEAAAFNTDDLFDKIGEQQKIWKPKKDFQDWLDRQPWFKELNGEFPPGWLDWNNPQRVFRGLEWWELRKAELANIIKNNGNETIRDEVRALFGEFEVEDEQGFTFEKAINEMIENNKKLFPHQDGRVDDESIVGTTYIAHGTIYAGQVFKAITPEGVEIMIPGGDRAHYGPFAEYPAWLISALAGSPEEQQAFIDEYSKRYGRGIKTPDGMQKMRELAIFTMYRAISDAPVFVKKGQLREGQVELGMEQKEYIEKARNLIRLAKNILTGNGQEWSGAWNGVNTPLA